jgi:hypothetical protein
MPVEKYDGTPVFGGKALVITSRAFVRSGSMACGSEPVAGKTSPAAVSTSRVENAARISATTYSDLGLVADGGVTQK